MSETASAPSLSDELGRYPDPSVTPHRQYGRRIWPMGEDCDDGVLVQGNDHRAWAALSAHARSEGLDRPGYLGSEVRSTWATFQTSCGCTVEEHAEHAKRKREDFDDWRARREAGDHTALPVMPTCEDLVAQDDTSDLDGMDCGDLPPCTTDRFVWRIQEHDPNGDLPETAAPVLVWTW